TLNILAELGIHNHSNELSSSKLVPKVVPPADKTDTSRQELELLFHHHITMLRSYALSWKPCQGDCLNLPDHRRILSIGSISEKDICLFDRRGRGPRACESHLSRAEKSLPLFKALKKCIKKRDFHWMPEAEQAFKQLKQHLSELPLLVAPKLKEELIIYMSASHRAISAVLMTERVMVQMPVYFVAEIFLSASYCGYYRPTHQTNNVTSRRGSTITKMERHAGRTQYHIPPTDVRKGTNTSGLPCGKAKRRLARYTHGTEFTYLLRFQFTASNNEAEYEALIAGLRIAAQIGVCNVHKQKQEGRRPEQDRVNQFRTPIKTSLG
ncbi:reverse transcriptase domain-containing protein, partial [Tanacetum coccineum]